jgi:hypothetical protein
MDDHHKLIEGACKVLGVIAMAACLVALVVPGLNILAAGALAAGSLSLLGHSALAATGNGSWVDVGMDVFALATFGAGRFLGPGIKVLGKPFGGALGRLTAETKAAGAMARGNAARMPIQTRINIDVLKAQERLVAGASNKVGRSVQREVKAIRAQGATDSQHAYNAAQSAYGAKTITATPLERLLIGGGDPELAALRVGAQDAAAGFSTTSKVGLAAAKANTQYMQAVSVTAASNVAGGANIYLDRFPVKAYDDWRNHFVTKEGGNL